jgi:hypothetical protein
MDEPVRDPRRSPRSRVLLAASLELGDRTLPVTLRDLSEHGALVQGEAGLNPQCEIWFCRNGLRVQGYVAWADGNQAGIAFSRALKHDEVLRYINRPERRTVDESAHRRPALTRPGMSAEERRWVEQMLRDPGRDSLPD